MDERIRTALAEIQSQCEMIATDFSAIIVP